MFVNSSLSARTMRCAWFCIFAFMADDCFANTEFQAKRLEDELFQSKVSLAICHAISDGDRDELRRLVDFGYDLNLQTDSGLTVLHWAVIADNSWAFEALLEAGADPHLTMRADVDLPPGAAGAASENLRAGSTVLGYVMENARFRKGFLDISTRYLRLPDQRDGSGRTLLHNYIAAQQLWKIPLSRVGVLLLINAGVDINAVDNSGVSAVRLAVPKPNSEAQRGMLDLNLTRLLVFFRRHCADLRLASKDGGDLLADLTSFGDSKVPWNYLEAELTQLKTVSDSDQQFEKREVGATRRDENIRDWVLVLINMFPFQEQREFCMSAQGLAGFKLGNPTRIRTMNELLATGMDMNTVGRSGFTFLLAAYGADNIDAFRLLLEHGANPDLRLSGDLIEVLTEMFPGADSLSPVFVPREGDSVVMAASLNPFSRRKFLPMLLEHTKDPNLLDAHGRNLLHLFLYHPMLDGQEDLLDLLIDAGVDLNTRSIGGSTPCHVAVAMNPEVIPRLVKAGADPTILNRQGQSVEDMLQSAIDLGWSKQTEYEHALNWLKVNTRDAKALQESR